MDKLLEHMAKPPWHDSHTAPYAGASTHDTPDTLGGSGGRPSDPRQEAALLARQHVPAAIAAIASFLTPKPDKKGVMRLMAPRGGAAILQAATRMLEISGDLQVAPVAVAPPALRLVDAQAAAEELRALKR